MGIVPRRARRRDPPVHRARSGRCRRPARRAPPPAPRGRAAARRAVRGSRARRARPWSSSSRTEGRQAQSPHGTARSSLSCSALRSREETWGPHVWVNSAGHAATRRRGAPRRVRRRGRRLGRGGPHPPVRRSSRRATPRSSMPGSGCRSASSRHTASSTPVEQQAAVPEGFSIRPPDARRHRRAHRRRHRAPAATRQLTPVFSGVAPWSPEESRAEWEQTIDDDKEHVLIGFQGERPVSLLSMADFSTRGTPRA